MPDTNPLLDEINGLSPGAKSALMQAHQQTQSPNPQIAAARTQAAQPIQPPPAPTGMQAPSQMQAPPQLGTSHPQVNLAPQPKGTLMGDQQALQSEANKRPALESVYSGITNSHFGQNHPVLGKILGALGQIPATAADVVSSAALGPRLGALIPGSSANRSGQMGALQTRIGQEEKNQGEEATTQATNAEIPLRQAQTASAQAEVPLKNAQTQEALNPQPKPKEEQWELAKDYTGPNGEPVEVEKNSGELRIAGQPNTGFKRIPTAAETKVPNAKEDLQRKLVIASDSGDQATVAKLQKQLKDIDPMGENRLVISQQTAANSANSKMDAKTQKEYEYTRNKWDKDLSSYHTQNEKLAEASQLVGNGAMGAALGSVKALSGLAGGQGSGVRITQAELNSIAHARGFQGNFDAFLQQFGDGNKLTPQQVQALKGIISDVQHVAAIKEQVLNKGLDDLSDATDTKSIRKIDSQLRHALMGGLQ